MCGGDDDEDGGAAVLAVMTGDEYATIHEIIKLINKPLSANINSIV